MANKCLQRCLRSGLLFFIHHRSHHPADRELLRQLYMQRLYSDPLLRSSCTSPHSTCSESARLLLHGRRCFPAAAFSVPSPCLSSDEDGSRSGEESLQPLRSGSEKQLARSHSCPKLHCRLLVPSFKSLRQRSHSYGHLHHGRHSQASSGGSASDEHARVSSDEISMSPGSAKSKYARSWSSPSLRRISRLAKRKYGASFHGELHESGSVQVKGKGKRAPKGHVVVYVDGGRERHAVPIPYLSHPYFEDLLQRAESEFGFAQKGGLLIPCSLAELEETLARIRLSDEIHRRHSTLNH